MTNLFASVLTYVAPSSNYRGESEANRTVLQKITRGGKEFTVISPESMRNALREIIAVKGLPCNRKRLHDEEQLAVEFQDYPDAEKFADDFFFGYMVAQTKDSAEMKKRHRPAKRDAILRMNLAMALTPYRFDATFHQSPMNSGNSPWKNSGSSALLHREVSCTAYQFPFALSLDDCLQHKMGARWTAVLLESVGELSNVAGGHARSFFEMAPKSVIVRITRSLVAGFDTYGFNEQGSFPELSRINANDLPGKEFVIGGDLVRNLSTEERNRLVAEGVTLFENPQAALRSVADQHLAIAAK